MDQKLVRGWCRTLLRDGRWYYFNEKGRTMSFRRPVQFHEIEPSLPDGHDALAADGWQLWLIYLSDPREYVWYNRERQMVASFNVFEAEFRARAAALAEERRAQREREDAEVAAELERQQKKRSLAIAIFQNAVASIYKFRLLAPDHSKPMLDSVAGDPDSQIKVT
ncbi:unnamed protein product [Symbiodinium microadriaticum]|nr:unnamed protein product [Symbiodinium microadriaticum]CAE7764366.1 unnamed protein product [Symbiodinium sp. KB8]